LLVGHRTIQLQVTFRNQLGAAPGSGTLEAEAGRADHLEETGLVPGAVGIAPQRLHGQCDRVNIARFVLLEIRPVPFSFPENNWENRILPFHGFCANCAMDSRSRKRLSDAAKEAMNRPDKCPLLLITRSTAV
jgi:hypothetical protein